MNNIKKNNCINIPKLQILEETSQVSNIVCCEMVGGLVESELIRMLK
jgi:hypothetical protein